jgi:hypothetical protein
MHPNTEQKKIWYRCRRIVLACPAKGKREGERGEREGDVRTRACRALQVDQLGLPSIILICRKVLSIANQNDSFYIVLNYLLGQMENLF